MPTARTELPLDQAAVLAALRSRVARLEGTGRAPHESGPIPVCEGMELPGGGLARAAVHDVLAVSPGGGAAFCAVLLARAQGTILWIACGGDALLAWPPGLMRFGLAPASLVLVRAERWSDALWAMEEALRCPAVGGALLAANLDEKVGGSRLDLTATRRLQLAAEAGGAFGLLLRPDTGLADPRAEASAAATRWRVGSLPAGVAGGLPVGMAGGLPAGMAGGLPAGPASGLDDPRWRLELLRAKGGPPGGPWAVTWRSETRLLHLEGTALAASREEAARVAARGAAG